MTVVAELLLAQGHEVAGSDREETATVQALRTAGATVHVGHDAQQVPADAVVVVSSAIKENNPELAIARARGQRIMHRSQALAFAASGRDFIAIAGAHGKTSTSAMLAEALTALGEDPSYAIGGSLVGDKPGGHLGAGTMLVAEADESDASFLNYAPRIEIVTNVEPDHLDHYGTRAAFEQAFVDFAHCLVPGGLLIACADDPGSFALALQAASDGLRVVTYGRTRGAGNAVAQKAAERMGIKHAALQDVPARPGALVSGVVEYAGARYPLDLRVPGAHMLLNAVGAWCAGIELGIAGAQMAQALQAFQGAARRFELVGEVGHVRVVDDYAHHPTEIAATLQAAREVVGDGKLRVLFQPHLYSRTKNFAPQFAQALSAADSVIITGVYAAREVPSDGVEGDAIADLLPGVPFIADRFAAGQQLAAQAQPGDLLITMGAGNVTAVGPQIVAQLSEKWPAAAAGAAALAPASEAAPSASELRAAEQEQI